MSRVGLKIFVVSHRIKEQKFSDTFDRGATVCYLREIIFQILDNTIVKWYYIPKENEKMYMQQSLYLKKAMAKQHITQVQLGEKTGQTQKNLSGKLYQNKKGAEPASDLARPAPFLFLKPQEKITKG